MADSLIDLERHRRERGLILELLSQAGAAQVAFTSLWRMMDARNQTLAQESLKFHLVIYLEPQGYVSLIRARDLKGWEDRREAPDAVISVKLLPKGIQLLNRAIEDSEVVIS
jgi:hypothetical protein